MLLIVLIAFLSALYCDTHCPPYKAEAVNCHEIVRASCDFRFIACYEAHELQISGQFKNRQSADSGQKSGTRCCFDITILLAARP